MRDSRPLLLFIAGPGGPDPEWWLPRLTEDYRLRILWTSPRERIRAAKHLEGQVRHVEHVLVANDLPWRARLAAEIAETKPDGVLAFSELVADVCHAEAAAVGLPATAPQAAAAMRSKFDQRCRLQEAGVPTPRFKLVSRLRELSVAVAQVGTPAILKPSVGVGSMATYQVESSSDLQALWASATDALLSDDRGDGEPTFILEELLEGRTQSLERSLGDQVSVESLVQGRVAHHLAISDKFPMAAPFRETGDLTTSTLAPEVLQALINATAAAIKALELDNCAVHTEFMLTRDGPRIIEVNGRIGGGVAQLLHYSCDYDVVGALARVATGADVGALPVPVRWAAQYLLQPPGSATTTVAKTPSSAELLALPHVVDAEVLAPVGTVVDPMRGTSARVARLFAVSDKANDLLALNHKLNDGTYFVYEPTDGG